MYLVRLAVVGLFLFSLAGLIGVVSLFPAYISIYTEEHIQTKLGATLKNDKEVANTTKLQNELQEDNRIIHTIAIGIATTTYPSQLIEKIAALRGQVRVNSITLGDTATTTVEIVVEGNSPTREALVTFENRLRNLAVGNKVDFPISSFAKSKDIPFSLKLTHILQ